MVRFHAFHNSHTKERVVELAFDATRKRARDVDEFFLMLARQTAKGVSKKFLSVADQKRKGFSLTEDTMYFE